MQSLILQPILLALLLQLLDAIVGLRLLLYLPHILLKDLLLQNLVHIVYLLGRHHLLGVRALGPLELLPLIIIYILSKLHLHLLLLLFYMLSLRYHALIRRNTRGVINLIRTNIP
jgi:hypothetical protein